ncbi:NUDIX hydrolase [Pseudomonas sp. D1HM]|uniref:NUDIX hydrolase n=1 Tax=Pseudomonas sp. D1HM TaxID=1784816 RepID=UPI001C4E99F5|nr:NUDIX hydrolase [Pseudomonas sp. D1HM]MBW0235371.1 ADP-ribose pyrophosphatase [Pseudomonas sp. D1HM]
MKFCNQCGHSVSQHIPQGDSRLRYVCDHCRTIHYQNPNIVAGCLPTWGTQVLLCRRAIEPRKGYWTLPAGFMENGETVEQAARRETLEEACAQLQSLSLYTLIDVPHINQVHIFYRAELQSLDFSAGEESLEVQLFEEADIPWSELAFRTVSRTLECFFADRTANIYPVRSEAVPPLSGLNHPNNQ